ncbi:MAG TPA: Holliday junction branch migration protein RuvA [Candidatus Dorea intestinavium]|nr:Holliday junction branch migration protein RuvA [Candidatus Dorea intestinavium]
MISYVKGTLAGVYDAKVVVDVGGVGYLIALSNATISNLPSIGEEVKIYTYLNVKDDNIQLFGFLTWDDLEIFKQLISVSGIGPKGGLSILSVLSPDDLRFAILAGDTKAINAAPGIGKKTAEKLIIELRDKIKIEDTLKGDTTSAVDAIEPGSDDIKAQSVMALVSLGYGNTEALRAVNKVKIEETDSVEDILKQALKFMI